MTGTFGGNNVAEIEYVERSPGYAVKLSPNRYSLIDFGPWSNIIGSASSSTFTDGESAFSVFIECKPQMTGTGGGGTIFRLGTAGPIYAIRNITGAFNQYAVTLISGGIHPLPTLTIAAVANLVIDDFLETWHSVAVTYNGNGRDTGLAMYWDGEAITPEISFNSVRNLNPGGNLTIGSNDNGSFVGEVDNFAVWNRAISAAEVAALHGNPTILA